MIIIIMIQRSSFEQELPSWESQAGNMSQTSCPTSGAARARNTTREYWTSCWHQGMPNLPTKVLDFIGFLLKHAICFKGVELSCP